MIDEVDSFQNDASFRHSMETCMDIYKKFPEKKRALVTATLQSFSDPALAAEPKTVFGYEKRKTRRIKIIHTQNLHGSAIDKINELLQADPGSKIMVAYNSVSGCFDIAQSLVQSGVASVEDVKILCSANSKDTVKKFYKELDSAELPGKINLATSAYFSGFDLKEQYHLISISNGTNNIYALSEHKLKQIAGRCRNRSGLFSETVLYQPAKYVSGAKQITPQELVDAAQNEIKALECLSKNFERNAVLGNQLKKIRDHIIKDTGYLGYNFLRYNVNIEQVIAYLSIDAAVESSRVLLDIYNEKTQLPRKLEEEGHQINFTEESSDTEVTRQDVEAIDKNDLVTRTIDWLKKDHSIQDIINAIDQPGIPKVQRDILETYQLYHSLVDKDQLLKEIEKGGKQKDSRYLNRLKVSLMFTTLKDSNLYKRTIYAHIQIGKEYTQMQLMQAWNTIYQELQLRKRISSTDTAVKITKQHFNVKKSRKASFKIGSDNPFGFTVINLQPNESKPRNLKEMFGL